MLDYPKDLLPLNNVSAHKWRRCVARWLALKEGYTSYTTSGRLAHDLRELLILSSMLDYPEDLSRNNIAEDETRAR